MDAPIPSLRPSLRQVLRRLISSFRHAPRKTPRDDLDRRAHAAADRIDRTAERAWCRRMAESRPAEIDDDWFERDEWKRREAIANSIYHGGQ